MLQGYVGYGVDIANEIMGEELFAFIQNHDTAAARQMVKDILGESKPLNELGKNELEEVADGAEAWISEHGHPFVASYIAKVICSETCDGLLTAVGGRFLVFPPFAFPEDIKGRDKYIKDRNDVRTLILSYFPESNLSFRDVYEGTGYYIT